MEPQKLPNPPRCRGMPQARPCCGVARVQVETTVASAFVSPKFDVVRVISFLCPQKSLNEWTLPMKHGMV